jgi:hypothetical protein
MFSIVKIAPGTVTSMAPAIVLEMEVAVLDLFNLIMLECVIAPVVDVQASKNFTDAATTAFDTHISCTNGVT